MKLIPKHFLVTNFSYISSTPRLLSELNPEVSGDCVDESVEQVLNNRPDFLTNFDLVIATEISEKTLVTLSNLLWDENIPMMVVKTYGKEISNQERNYSSV